MFDSEGLMPATVKLNKDGLKVTWDLQDTGLCCKTWSDLQWCHCWTGKPEAQHAACNGGLRWPFGSRELNQIPGRFVNPKDTVLSLQWSLPVKALL